MCTPAYMSAPPPPTPPAWMKVFQCQFSEDKIEDNAIDSKYN